tara:strand:+ start:5316 stop:6083 length:768 start_codon:yes stop_codon:yes gene_type:complete
MQTQINNNISISKIGLGTVKFGRNTQVKYPNKFNLPTDKEISELLELAFSFNINTIDTAPSYGTSQERLGKLLPYSRDNWVIISKAGEEFINNQSYYNFDADFISLSLDKTLKTLKTDYIDIFLIHSDGNDLNIAQNNKLWDVLNKRKALGDIKAFGVSSKTSNGGLECLKKSDLAMIELNDSSQNLLDYAYKNNKNIILKKIFNSGHLNNASSIQQAYKKAFSHPAVNSAIIGTINKMHLHNNVNEFEHYLYNR